ncbi:uncharacterized protein A1O9_13060 [Exophiala aquamarina CBS 119918]|uniref:HNH nuclease domain-containing protein n=1 Tax=Exophiala aquamarina CBS 119918 TaxID=1182545 RepID=A0A072P5J9_9EURO|nr:uncharacterized protein A1O9_13060 [Exophiala aquamarina CBS 119918]KEF50890.1 hypothetical protein A1O9_13060 [Exophiala aquamarina CBS 119918]
MTDLGNISKPETWQIYDPYPEPSHPQKLTRPTDFEPIKVRHPCYQDDSCNVLLKFWSHAHHETVRVACAIVANNAWVGYLSTDRGGNDPIVENTESTLTRKSYYFHVAQPINGEVVDYPVVPTFEHWRFPTALPLYWREISNFLQRPQPPPDSRCRLTQCDYSVENAHLIPAVEKEWFDKNSMSDYTDSTAVDKMNHPNNTIRFKSDVHTIFDSKRFAIVPAGGRLVAYCLNARPGSHIERFCHGVELHRLNNPPQLLLARFGYTVFEDLRDFLDARVARKLLLWTENTWTTEICNFERCQQFSRATASQGKSRSASPKKRSKMQESEELEEFDVEWSDEEALRGRKKQRTSESIELSDRESSLLPDTPQDDIEEKCSEAQLRTRQAMDESRDTFAETISYLRKRPLIQDDDPENEERSQLLARHQKFKAVPRCLQNG